MDICVGVLVCHRWTIYDVVSYVSYEEENRQSWSSLASCNKETWGQLVNLPLSAKLVFNGCFFGMACWIHRCHILDGILTAAPERYLVIDVKIGLQPCSAPARAPPTLFEGDYFLRVG